MLWSLDRTSLARRVVVAFRSTHAFAGRQGVRRYVRYIENYLKFTFGVAHCHSCVCALLGIVNCSVGLGGSYEQESKEMAKEASVISGTHGVTKSVGETPVVNRRDGQTTLSTFCSRGCVGCSGHRSPSSECLGADSQLFRIHINAQSGEGPNTTAA